MIKNLPSVYPIKLGILSLAFMLVLVFNASIKAQDTIIFRPLEDSLSHLCNTIYKIKNDSDRLKANAVFLEKFRHVLDLPAAFNYPFDSITGISKLKSDDGRIRVVSWNVPLNNGSFRYFGFVEVNEGKIFELQESLESAKEWSNKILPSGNWYGALYFKLITNKYRKETYYTLLGWDGNNEVSNIKLIDVLYFDQYGSPFFGKPIFKTREGLRNRVVIEFAENAIVLLRYDYQTLKIPKGKRIKYRKAWMIVTDRLLPMTAAMEGIRKYYVPAGDTYDAYLFNKGYWSFVEDIMVGNSSNR
jgi:hypothetical protein